MEKSFLLRQKNIDTFEDSNCLFGIACMERLKGEAVGRNIQKKEEALSTRPNPAPSLSNIYPQWFSYNTQSEH